MGSVRAIRGSAMPAGPVTQGMTRKVVEVDEHISVAEGHNDPHGISGWHHHGEHTTCVYVAEGQMHIEWGPGGRESTDVASGDFYVMSPNTIHRESNPGAEKQLIVAFQAGSGPVVVNVDGPEPD